MERQYADAARRYPNATLPLDFVKLVSSWMQAPTEDKAALGCTLLALDKPVALEHEADFEVSSASEKAPQHPTTGGTHYVAKVLLSGGLDEEATKALRAGPGHGGDHLHNLLKFVTMRTERAHTRSGIQAPGGAVDSEDGDPASADPDKAEAALVAAAKRHVHEQLGLDLSRCGAWRRLCELHYERPAPSGHALADVQKEVVVYFVTDLSEALPSASEWPEVWQAQQEWRARKKEHDTAKTAAKEKEHTEQKAHAEETVVAAATGSGAGKEVSNKSDKKEGSEAMDIDEKPSIKSEDAKSVAKSDGKGTEPDAASKEGSAEKKAEEPKKEGKERDRKQAAKEDATELPATPALLLRGRRTDTKVWRSQAISLDGLLDYEEDDREEATVELSLAAEALAEALAAGYGGLIADHLLQEREAAHKRREERKRKREAEEAAKAAISDNVKGDTAAAAEGGGSKRAASEAADEEGSVAKRVKPEDVTPQSNGIDTKIEGANSGAAEPAAAADTDGATAAGATGGKGETEEDTALAGKAPAAQQKGAAAKKGLAAKQEQPPARVTRGRAKKDEAGSAPEEAVAVGSTDEGGVDASDGPPAEANGSAADVKTVVKTEDDAAEPAPAVVEAAAKPVLDVKAEPEEVLQTALAEAKSSAPDGSDPPPDAPEGPTVNETDAGAAGIKAADEKQAADKKEAERKAKKYYKTDANLLVACRYFDHSGCGYFRVDDLRRLLHVLGRGLPHWLVREAAGLLAQPDKGSRSARAERVALRDIYDREVPAPKERKEEAVVTPTKKPAAHAEAMDTDGGKA